jgi:hypothetical protein
VTSERACSVPASRSLKESMERANASKLEVT